MRRHRERRAWLTIGGTTADLIDQDPGEAVHQAAAAEAGRFQIHREAGYAAGIATHVLAGELALGRVLAGDLPRPRFPPTLRESAPTARFRLAAGAPHLADAQAGRQDRAACPATPCQAVLAAAQGRLAAAGEWVPSGKRRAERAGLGGSQNQLGHPEQALGTLAADARAPLARSDDAWTGE